MLNRIVALTLAIAAARPQDGFSDRLTVHFDGIPSTADVQVALSKVGDSEKFAELLEVSELPQLGDLTTEEVEETVILRCEEDGIYLGSVFIEFTDVNPVSGIAVE